jgi:hypothetical protein
MELFYYFKNENLRLALFYRMTRQYKLAKKHLLLAAEVDGDGQALYVLAETYSTGGFGIKRTFGKAQDLYQRSSNAGCLWGKVKANTLIDSLDDDIYAKGLFIEREGLKPTLSFVQKLFERSEENVLIYPLLYRYRYMWLFLNNDQKENVKTAGLKFSDALIQYNWDLLSDDSANQRFDCALKYKSEEYYNPTQYEKAMYYALKYDTYFSLVFDILRLYPTHKIHFMYGRKAIKHLPEDHSQDSILIYQNTIQMCRQAVYCFIWVVYKKKRWMSKDVVRLVGKMIYASRNDPDLWNARAVKRNKKI